jgi:coenzyme F420-reducing hydrogenase alpha subunit
MSHKIIKVDYLARVEGEGSLTITFKGNQASRVQLSIFEPPRFFEAFLKGRRAQEAPDITARICGICPVAYQMSACHAIEQVLGITVDGPLRGLRRLLYCGEWIESHVLHAYMLHAPDFMGYQDSLSMAKDHPDLVKAGLRIKKAGNAIVERLGGRAIHPVNVRVGGFYRLPTRDELQTLAPELEWALQAAQDGLKIMAGFRFPDFERDYEFVALRHPDEYPFNEGRLVSNKGLDIAVADYEDHFEERQVEHSNALQSVIKKRGAYFCGPLARFNLNYDKLSPLAKNAAQAAGLSLPVCNPFKSLLVRMVEVIQAIDEALRIIEGYEMADRPFIDVPMRAGRGTGCTEAPRGSLYHRYDIDDEGLITFATIVPPTSQNQKTIEDDLFAIAPTLADLPHADATWLAEQTVRNYDPCISCATHFLTLNIVRE